MTIFRGDDNIGHGRVNLEGGSGDEIERGGRDELQGGGDKMRWQGSDLDDSNDKL